MVFREPVPFLPSPGGPQEPDVDFCRRIITTCNVRNIFSLRRRLGTNVALSNCGRNGAVDVPTSLWGLIMAKVQKATDSSSLAEVVDRILDKGIVIDAWVKVSLVGIELLSIEARVVIASVETYLKYAEAIGLTATAAAPAA
jgi:hypothetical protein